MRNLGLSVLAAASMAAALVAATPDFSIVDAAARGDSAAVAALIKKGVPVNTPRADGMTALHEAADRGDAQTARLLLAAGANAEALTRLGYYSPLHLASRMGRAEVVTLLLQARSNPRTTTNSGVTPLHLAAQSGNVDVVKSLLDHGADANAMESTHGQTPLMFAAAANRADAIKLLVARGANVSARTAVTDMPTQEAVDKLARKRRDEVLEEFRNDRPAAEYATWRPTPEQVQTAVAAAIEVQNAAKGKRLGDGNDEEDGRPAGEYVPGYSGQVGSSGGMTALLHAARQGNKESAMALVDAGADINQFSGDHSSPILIATLNGQLDLAIMLLARGADPNIASDAGTTPLFAAINVEWAARSRYPQPRAHDLQKATYLDTVKALLEKGANPNLRLSKSLWYMSYNHCCAENTDGATPFWRAAYALDVEAMKLLVAHGADPKIATRAPIKGGGMGGGAAAAKKKDPSGLEPLPERGPAAFPIHAASGLGYGEGFESNAHRHVPDAWLPAVKYLVEVLGADVNERDYNGYTPIHHAASRGDNELINYLVSKGADATAISRRGETTADMANGPYQRTQPYPETIKLLESLGSKNNHHCVSC